MLPVSIAATAAVYHCFTVTCFNSGFMSTFECRQGQIRAAFGAAGAGGHGEAEPRAALHLCSVCFSAQAPCTWDTVFPDVLHPSAGTPRTLNAAAAEDTSQAPGDDLSPPPPPVFEITTRNRFAPLREMARLCYVS